MSKSTTNGQVNVSARARRNWWLRTLLAFSILVPALAFLTSAWLRDNQWLVALPLLKTWPSLGQAFALWTFAAAIGIPIDYVTNGVSRPRRNKRRNA